jgi:DNA-binding MarR family transcriptional regulator
MSDPKDVFSKLVVDEKETLKELERLVDAATKIFRIERPSGQVVFQDFGGLTDKQRILAILVAKYFASKMQIIEDPALSISEIARELGRPMTALSGDIRDIVKKGFVEYLPGRKYRIAYHRLTEIFEGPLVKKQSGR